MVSDEIFYGSNPAMKNKFVSGKRSNDRQNAYVKCFNNTALLILFEG